MLGTGRGTTLLWGGGGGAGPDGDGTRLFWSNGANRFLIEGFVFDGAGVGGVGLDHDSKSQYESRVIHRHLSFVNWTVAGVRVGHAQYVASAELLFYNCLFAYNGAGIRLGSWNDFDNYVSGCYFFQNGYGILAYEGNYYVSNSRFENSTIADATLSTHANSFRRVVSVGSAGSFITSTGGGSCAPTKLHNVLVTAYCAECADPMPFGARAAIWADVRIQMELVDTTFDSPMLPNLPVLSAGDSCGGCQQALLLSNVTLSGGANRPYLTSNLITHNYSLPAGSVRPFPLSASTQFFTSAAIPPPASRVFDAIVDFGANNSASQAQGPCSTAALQACIDAAAAAGGGAVCYLPAGHYCVNSTLQMRGDGAASYGLEGGGSGFGTFLSWDVRVPGPAVVLAVGPGAGGPRSIALPPPLLSIRRLNFQTWGAENVTGGHLDLVVARGAAVPASPAGRHAGFPLLPVAGHSAAAIAPLVLTLDAVFFQSTTGAVFSGLAAGDVVSGPLWDGNLEVIDCGDATLLASFYSVGQAGLVVGRTAKGGAGNSSGLLGFAALVAASSSPFDLYLYNNSGLVAADHYTETSQGSLFASGDATSPPGLVALSYSKLHTNPQWQAVRVDGYAGGIVLTGAIAADAALNSSVAGGPEGRPLEVAFAMSCLWVPPVPLNASGQSATVSKTGVAVATAGPDMVWDPDVRGPGTFALLARALDAQRALANADIAINFPWLLPAEQV